MLHKWLQAVQQVLFSIIKITRTDANSKLKFSFEKKIISTADWIIWALYEAVILFTIPFSAAFDFDKFAETMDQLERGVSVTIPRYDNVTSRRLVLHLKIDYFVAVSSFVDNERKLFSSCSRFSDITIFYKKWQPETFVNWWTEVFSTCSYVMIHQ